MKKYYLSLILMLTCISACKTIFPGTTRTPETTVPSSPITIDTLRQINFSEQSTWLLGYFNRDRLTYEPHSAWYLKGYDSYMPGSEPINKLLEINRESLSIKIILGTWCPDSRREVPRFMRILDIWQFPLEKITLIGVDDAKLSPVGEYDSLDITRVPTFIIYRNNVEAGRIIENPATSLEQDIVNILNQ